MNSSFAPWQHNYLRELLKDPHELLKPGSVTMVTVRHDDWCAFFRGGYCDCNVEIVRRPMEVEAGL